MNTKTPIFFTSLLFAVLLQGVVFSQETSPLSKGDVKSAITAGDYCQFLNSVAAADPDHLYDEKMSASSGLIIRTGEPGGYYYEVMNGKEEIPITFVSELHATHYLTWLQDPSLTFIANASPGAFDEQLQVTDLNFYLIKNSSLNSIQQSSGVEAGLMEEFIGEEIFSIVAVLAGGEIANRDVHAEQDNHLLAHVDERAQFKFQDLPDDIQRKTIFLSPEMPSESENKYIQQYKKALADFQTKDPHLAEQMVSWEEAHDECRLAKGENKASAHQRLKKIEDILPLEAHTARAFYLAGTVVDKFKSFQEKWFKDLMNQEERNLPYFLQSATKINDILSQATANVNALLEIMQTCQEESDKKEIKEVPFITEKYKIVAIWASEAIDEYTPLIQEIETKDASRIRSFLQKREQRQVMIAAKPRLCNSLLGYRQRMEDCKEVLTTAGYINDNIQILERADSCFNDTIQATSCHAQALIEKAGDYHLQEAEEIADHGNNTETKKAWNLHEAAFETQVAGKAFEKAARATSPQVKAAYDKALDYYLQSAEERAINGFTNKAASLKNVASLVKGAGEAFEKAARLTIAAHDFTNKAASLMSAANAAIKEADVFERASVST